MDPNQSCNSLASVVLSDVAESQALADRIIGAFFKNETVPGSKDVRTVVFKNPTIMELVKTGAELVKKDAVLERKELLISALRILSKEIDDSDKSTLLASMIEHNVIGDIIDIVLEPAVQVIPVEDSPVAVSCWKCWT